MKKVSTKLFFTILWRGVCQAFEWFFGLFGYMRDGKFAKCIWRIFATSVTVIVAILAFLLVWSIGETVYDKHYKEIHCYDPNCYYSEHISLNVYYHNMDNGKGYVFNNQTGEKTVRNIKWIAKPNGKDSLICFSNGKKRGYFNKNTGLVVVEPKYDHAWIFSDGLASVEESGHIKFIDSTGKVVLDKNIAYIPNADGYVFHGGYCVIGTNNGEYYGLMDRKGKMVIQQKFNSVSSSHDGELWIIQKEKEMSVLDKDLKPIIPMMECSVCISESTIDITMPDHTIRKYDLEGKLINDFYITSFRMLEYEKDDFVNREDTQKYVDNEIIEVVSESYHPKATAKLRAYSAGDGYEGLMTADGHKVSMPLYKDIEAIGYDVYLCTVTNGDKLIVNGKGEIVK